MATYNRAQTIERAINSVLCQTYKNIELIIVDDGSNDATCEVLLKYSDPRIRIFRHDKNKGVTAAKNTGLKQIKGEWFTTFDSDDEMLPEAIETMVNIPLRFDNSITAITCNCKESISGLFTGKGLTQDGYINGNEIISFCQGEFWGLTRTSLLMGDLFNEMLFGIESTLWYKINARAKTYYIHKALNIIHVEGKDRISVEEFNSTKEISHFENLINEEYYLYITNRYRPASFYNICRTGILLMEACKKMDIASKYYQLFKKYSSRNLMIELFYRFRIISIIYRISHHIKV
jgi:glycosyltransferase involved in cell wall biosynthesis